MTGDNKFIISLYGGIGFGAFCGFLGFLLGMKRGSILFGIIMLLVWIVVAGSVVEVNECSETCSGTTPLCLKGECKRCSADNKCAADTPVCNEDGSCARLPKICDPSCTGATPVCADGTCVKCDELLNKCPMEKPVCNIDGGCSLSTENKP